MSFRQKIRSFTYMSLDMSGFFGESAIFPIFVFFTWRRIKGSGSIEGAFDFVFCGVDTDACFLCGKQ